MSEGIIEVWPVIDTAVVIKPLPGELAALCEKNLLSQGIFLPWVDDGLFPSVGFRWRSLAGDCKCLNS